MQLVKYEAACTALAEAKSTDEVKNIRDMSEAMRAYAKQANNKQLEVDAAEIRLRAERRLGELIQRQKETVGLNPGTRTKGGGEGAGGSVENPPAIPTLSDAGIGKGLADRARKLAAVPDDEFEDHLDDWRERVSRENERVTTNLLKAGDKARGKKSKDDVERCPTCGQPYPKHLRIDPAKRRSEELHISE